MVSPNLRDFSEILFFDHLYVGAYQFCQNVMKFNELEEEPKNVTMIRKRFDTCQYTSKELAGATR